MEAIYLFILLLIGLTIILGIILGDSSRTDVIAHWAERRCDFDVMIAAFTYKPADDTRSPFEFSSDNFRFCVGSKTSDYLKTIFGALFEVLRKQMDAGDVMGQVMKVLRVQLNNIYAPFSKMMNNFWVKFKQMGALASRIFQHLYMAMKKAAATAIASVYAAIALQTSFLNGIDLVINVIMIVLYIMLALAVIFFLPLLPVMVFVFMATAGIESAFPGRTGGMGAVFCFAPDTQIVMRDLTLKRIDQINLGDILLSNQKVQAVIQVPGSSAPLYNLDGVLVSGDHRIWNIEKQDWILVKDDPSAIKTTEVLDTLWTLITSNRQIPVASSNDVKLFSDWEELPTSDESAVVWETIVRSILTNTAFKSTMVPQHAPCFDKTILVKKYQAGWVPISTIQRGDWIMNEKHWTRVIGTCEREVGGGIGDKGARMSDGVWIKGGLGGWNHPKGPSDSWSWQGCTLITDSGSFNIRLSDSTDHTVRDFTEVGWMNLSKTYTRVGAMMSR